MRHRMHPRRGRRLHRGNPYRRHRGKLRWNMPGAKHVLWRLHLLVPAAGRRQRSLDLGQTNGRRGDEAVNDCDPTLEILPSCCAHAGLIAGGGPAVTDVRMSQRALATVPQLPYVDISVAILSSDPVRAARHPAM